MHFFSLSERKSFIDKLIQQVNSSISEETGSFKRKLSKREKKQLKKQEKLRRMKSGAENDTNVAEKLYSGE